MNTTKEDADLLPWGILDGEFWPYSHALKNVANLWTEFTAFDCYAMGADVKECKNLRKYLVAATW